MGTRVQPDILKLAAAAVLKPWGLRHTELLDCTSICVGVGELWLASAQTGPGNYASRVVEPPLDMTLADVLAEAADAGEEALRALIGDRPLAALKDSPHRGKTEAWLVRQVRGRVGLASGPRTGEQRDRLREAVQRKEIGPDPENWSPEVRELLGLVEPVRAGEVFLVPWGTLHTMFALGRESRLIIDEIQQGYGASLLPTLSKILMVQDGVLSLQVHPGDETVRRAATGEMAIEQDLEANPTVRVSDFGRGRGENPELGFELIRPEAGLRRCAPVEVELDGGGRLAVLVACPDFAKSRLSLPAGVRAAVQPNYGSYRILHCISGCATIEGGGRRRSLAAGETAFVPAGLESGLVVRAGADCELLEDTVPEMGTLRSFLEQSGVTRGEFEALWEPPEGTAGVE